MRAYSNCIATTSRLGCLVLCAFVLALPTRGAAADAPFTRLGVAIEGTRKAAAAAEAMMDAALGSAGLADPVHPDGMRRGAARLRIRGAWSTSAARQVGRAVHVTHVAVIRLVSRTTHGDKQMFAELTLQDVFNERTLFHQSYYLPEGQLTQSTAQTILVRVRALLESGHEDDPQDEAATPAAPTAGMRSHDIDTESKSGHEHTSADDAEVGANGEFVNDRPALANESHWSLGPSLGMRDAWLGANHAQVGTPCYCHDGGFSQPMLGLDARFTLLFDPAVSNFGLDLQGLMEYAAAGVMVTSQSTTSVQEIFWRMQAAVAYRFNLPSDVALRMQLGFAYTRYPLSHGAFPSLSYSAPSIGLHLLAPLGSERVNLELGSDFLAFVYPGNNAHVLGNPTPGLGARAALAVRVALGPLELSAGASYDFVRVTFAGATTFKGVVNLTDAVLYDQHLGVFLRLGSRF